MGQTEHLVSNRPIRFLLSYMNSSEKYLHHETGDVNKILFVNGFDCLFHVFVKTEKKWNIHPKAN